MEILAIIITALIIIRATSINLPKKMPFCDKHTWKPIERDLVCEKCNFIAGSDNVFYIRGVK